jgi:FkbM family methyltransferase
MSRSSLSKLRPAKIRRALRRRWFEARLARTRLHPVPGGVLDVGSAYGGWMIAPQLMGSEWLCYCVGAGGDVAFDLELIARWGATVRCFDAVEGFVDSALEQAGGEPRLTAHHAAIATADGPLRMQLSHDERSSSVSSAGLYESDRYVELPGRTISSLMRELGDERIDLLKLDVEGAEYEIVPALDLRSLGVKVFAVQLHHTAGVARARALIEEVRRAGYEPVACRPVVKLTFVAAELLGAGAPDGAPVGSGGQGRARG